MGEIVNENNPRVVPDYAPVPAAELPRVLPYGPVNGVEVVDQPTDDVLTIDEGGVVTDGEASLGRSTDSPFGRNGQSVDTENADGVEPDGDPESLSARVTESNEAPSGDEITPEGANKAAAENENAEAEVEFDGHDPSVFDSGENSKSGEASVADEVDDETDDE